MYWGFVNPLVNSGVELSGLGKGRRHPRVGAKRLVATLQGPSGIRERRQREAEQDFFDGRGQVTLLFNIRFLRPRGEFRCGMMVPLLL